MVALSVFFSKSQGSYYLIRMVEGIMLVHQICFPSGKNVKIFRKHQDI